ncbi:MAG: cytochrome P450, partial [Coxiellaceae bacterium]|nr:cytochrome P450 [Coxiellaceae bacterium]
MSVFFNSKPFKQLSHIPGEFGQPYVGLFPRFLKSSKESHRYLYDTYGPVVKVALLGQPSIMLYHPDGIEKILYDKLNVFSSHQGYANIDDVFPRGLLFRDGEDHHFHRRIMQAAFTPKALQGYIPDLNRNAKIYLDHYDKQSDVLFYPDVKHALLTTASTVFMGAKDEKEIAFLSSHYRELLNGTRSVLRVDLPFLPWGKMIQTRKELVNYFLENAKNKRASNNNDMYTLLCQATDEDGNTYDDHEIADHMNFLMFAAHDTLSGQLSSMVYRLAAHPEWQD